MFCKRCAESTKYACIQCKVPVCNRSLSCSVPVSEAFEGWKASACAGLDKHAYVRTHVRENVKTMEARTALLN